MNDENFSMKKLIGLVESLPTSPFPTCLILIEPKNSRVGMLEERGDWILIFWKNVLEKYPFIQGQQYTWGGAVFFSTELSLSQMVEILSKLLRESIHPQLKSKAVFSIVQNDTTQKFRELGQMELQLNKINYWSEHIYQSYFEDGIEKILNIEKES